jgi:hypothetical protein
LSKLTHHYTPEQKKALYCKVQCERQAKLIDRHWRLSAPYFAKMLNEHLFEELDMASFSEFCESIGVSASHGYSLAQLFGLPQDVKDSLQRKNVTLGKLKVILPKLEQAVEDQDDDQVEELIDDAARMRWSDLRQEVSRDTPTPKPVPTECPSCGATLELSRAAQIVTFHKVGNHA